MIRRLTLILALLLAALLPLSLPGQALGQDNRPLYRNLPDLPVVDVRRYGAKGNGVADDHAAFQAAVNAAKAGSKRVYAPAGNYYMTGGIDATDCPGLIIEGPSNRSTTLTIAPGNAKACIDFTGSPAGGLKNLKLSSENPATCGRIGVVFARSTVNQYAEFTIMDDVIVSMATKPSLNGGLGTIAVYNNAAELCRGKHVYALADTAGVITAYNIAGYSSPYTTHYTAFTSMSQVDYDGSWTLTAFEGPALLLDGAIGVTFTELYCNAYDNAQKYAIKVVNSGTRITISAHIEDFENILWVDRTTVDGLNLNVSYHPAAGEKAILLDSGGGATPPGIKNGTIFARPFNANVHELIGVDDLVGFNYIALQNLTVHLASTQKLVTHGGYTSGLKILSDSLTPDVTLGGNGFLSAMLMSKDRSTIYGPLDLATATSSAYALTFGTDTNLYRNAANDLKTDDNFTVGGALNVATGGAASANLYGAAGTQASAIFYDNFVSKWQLGKQTNNDFFLYNATTATNAFSIDDATNAVAFGGSVTVAGGTNLNGAVSVTSYGAIPGDATDDTAAITSALAAGKPVLFPRGVYVVSGQIALPTEAALHFDYATFNSTYGGALFKMRDKGKLTGHFIVDGQNTAGAIGLSFDGSSSSYSASHNTIESVQVVRCPVAGIDFAHANAADTGGAYGTYYNHVGYARVNQCGTSVRFLDALAAPYAVNSNSFGTLVTQDATGDSVVIDGADGTVFGKLSAEGCAGWGLDLKRGLGVAVNGGWLEGNTPGNVRIANYPAWGNAVVTTSMDGTFAAKVSHAYNANRRVEFRDESDAARTFGPLSMEGDLSLTGGLGISGTVTFGGDVTLYRSAANELKTDDSFFAPRLNALPAAVLDTVFASYKGGETSNRFVIRGDGHMMWSDGTALDTNLYRSAADTLKTDDGFVAGGTLSTTGGVVTASSATGIARLNLQAAAGQQATVVFADAGVTKWQAGKQTNNDYFLFNGTTSTNALSIDDATNSAAFGGGVSASSLTSTGTVTGTGLRVSEAANGKQGVGTLAGGTVTISNTGVTASSRIILCAQDNNTTGSLRVSARTAGASFTITSSNAADSGVVAYQIFEPAP